MSLYYIPILLTMVSVLGGLTANRRLDRALLAVYCLFVVSMSGLRFFSDVDYEGYFQMYQDIPGLGDLSRADLRRIYGEPGYLLLTSMLKSVGSPFFIVTLLASAVSVIGKSIVAARFVPNASLVLAIYLCVSFVTIEFIQIRWAIASALIALGYSSMFFQRRRLAFLYLSLAISIHYFSILFVLLMLVIRVDGYWRYLFVLLFSLSFSVSAKLAGLSFYFELDSGIYLISRLLRYVNDPQSSVGAFSYLKILLYLVAIIVFYNLDDIRRDVRSDRRLAFLFRSSITLLSAALILSFVPILFFRTMVLADFFSITLIVYMICKIDALPARAYLTCGIAGLFALWCFFDVGNYARVGRITPYESWLQFIV